MSLGQANRSRETRRRLLEAAVEVFAEEGFRNATLQDISQRAGANIAAAHYHFGGKEALYAAVFDYAERSRPPDPPSAARDGLSPADRLSAHIAAFLGRLLDPGRPAWFARLLARELIEPTRALDRVVRRRVRANHEQLSSIIRDLVPDASPETIRLCTLSVIAQCVFYRNSAALIGRLYPDLVPAREVDRIAAHVTRFSLAALRGLRSGKHRRGRRS
jgi:AcrR family transcriptional regulator